MIQDRYPPPTHPPLADFGNSPTRGEDCEFRHSSSVFSLPARPFPDGDGMSSQEAPQDAGRFGRTAKLRASNMRKSAMAFVVTEPCRGCKDTSCVTACPCDCF